MKKLILLFVVSFFLSINTNKASHFAGADLSYLCLGGNAYLISLTMYRDCSGINAPAVTDIFFDCFTNPAFNFMTTLNKLPNTGFEVTQSCPAAPSTCKNGNLYGIQAYTYQKIVTLPGGIWKMHYSSCCRNPITTIPQNGSNGYFVGAELNNLVAPCNSSPVFTNLPILVTQNNQFVNYNHGVIEPDGDSLAYSFYAPFKTSFTDSILYSSPYHSRNFLNSSIPITIDSQSGNINFLPTTSLTTATGVKVEEFRKINGTYLKIGTVYRDMQLKVYNGVGNNYPVLSGINKSNSKTYNPNDTDHYATYYLGDTIRFTLNGFDADTFNSSVSGSPEKFSISSSNSIPSASIQTLYNGTDSAYLSFYWVPTHVDTTNIPNYLFVLIQDEACPYNGKQIFTYGIRIDSIQPPSIGIQTSKLPNQHSLTVYPNPSQGLFNVLCKGISGTYKMEVLNTIGEVIYSKSEQINHSKSELQIDLSAYPKGVYILRLSNAEQEYRSKLLVQ